MKTGTFLQSDVTMFSISLQVQLGCLASFISSLPFTMVNRKWCSSLVLSRGSTRHSSLKPIASNMHTRLLLHHTQCQSPSQNPLLEESYIGGTIITLPCHCLIILFCVFSICSDLTSSSATKHSFLSRSMTVHSINLAVIIDNIFIIPIAWM